VLVRCERKILLTGWLTSQPNKLNKAHGGPCVCTHEVVDWMCIPPFYFESISMFKALSSCQQIKLTLLHEKEMKAIHFTEYFHS
jgi:hypothetical protein